LTADALEDQDVDVIYQAHFAIDSDQRRGQVDFLERNDAGEWEPVDTKLARSVKPYMIHQLCFYCDAMLDAGLPLPEQFHVQLGSGERATFRTHDYLHYCRLARSRLNEYVAGDAWRGEYPWPSEALNNSGLKEEAEAIWEADDHLIRTA